MIHTGKGFSIVNDTVAVVFVLLVFFLEFPCCTPLVVDADNWGGYACVWSGTIKETYVYLFNFKVTVKLL